MVRHLMMMLSVSFVVMVVGIISSRSAYGAVSHGMMEKIDKINGRGPYLGIVVPNSFETNPLLHSPSFLPDHNFSYVDFSVKGIVHYGIAGNANPHLQVGDVTIPQYWAHSGLWNWQRYGDGPSDELALESGGDYTRKIGYLEFSDYNNETEKGNPVGNFLNNVWYQPEEVFSVNGTPEVRQHAFWVPVNKHYFTVAEKLKQGLELESCVNTTCLPRKPRVVRVKRGLSANVFVDNGAYRTFLNAKFNATPIDMESAAIALVCLQQKTAFIAIRSLSDLAGGGSALSNEADIFYSLAAQNAVDAVVKFIALLFS